MNGSVCGGMMGVAGLAVLPMTAPLAGAQTGEVTLRMRFSMHRDGFTVGTASSISTQSF